MLQAETEDEMKDWISAFDKAKRLAIQNEQLPPRVTSLQQPADEHNSDTPDAYEPIKRTYSHVDAPFATDTTASSPIHSEATTDSKPRHDSQPTIVLLSTSADNDRVSLANSTSLTPLLVWEAARAPTTHSGATPFMHDPPTTGKENVLPSQRPQDIVKGEIGDGTNNGTRSPAKRSLNLSINKPSITATANTTWGIPWTLVPSMFQSSGDSNDPPPTPSIVPPTPLIGDSDGHQVIWPANLDNNAIPKVELTEYSAELEKRNQELRNLFGGVAAHEVVLDGKKKKRKAIIELLIKLLFVHLAFICSLKKPPNTSPKDKIKEDDDLDWPTSPIGSGSLLEQMEQELQHQLIQNVQPPTSDFGYSYTGRAFVTQETFWLYSCVMMTCVNTVAVRLKDITNIRLIRDPSITNTGKQSNIALAIDLKQDDVSPNREPLMLVTLMDDVEVVAEKLRIAVDNAKSLEVRHKKETHTPRDHYSCVFTRFSLAPCRRCTIFCTTCQPPCPRKRTPPSPPSSNPNLSRHIHPPIFCNERMGISMAWSRCPLPSHPQPPLEKTKRKGQRAATLRAATTSTNRNQGHWQQP